MAGSTVIFDLDGTLVDTAGDLVATLNFILAGEGCAPVPLELARPLIGRGARALLEKGLQANNRVLDAEKVTLLTERFIQYYSAHIADHSSVKPGLRDVLDELTTARFKLAICTNKRESLAQQLLDALKLDHYFSAIVGSGRFDYGKPDPRILLATIAAAGGSPRAALMVGDSITDVATARAAEIPVIVVDFGYTDIPPHELKADKVISNWAELPPSIMALAPYNAV